MSSIVYEICGIVHLWGHSKEFHCILVYEKKSLAEYVNEITLFQMIVLFHLQKHPRNQL